MASKPSFISLVDRNNKPILIYVIRHNEYGAESKLEVNDVLKFNVLSNMSLDYFESDLFNWMEVEKYPEIKLLFQLEGVSVFGKLVEQTGLKIIIGFPQEVFLEGHQPIMDTFKKVSKIYVQCKCNPFVNDDKTLIEQLERKLDDQFA